MAAALWERGSLGVESLPAAGGRRVRLCAWYPGRLRRRGLESRVAEALAAAGARPTSPARIVRVRERPWVERWQASLRPMRVGRRFLILPEGRRAGAAARRDRRVIRVRFGQAFGTGEHASTRLALRLMEGRVRRRDRVLDLGTGTGILAIAAARLGASRVTAVDDDPVALAVARETLRDNALAGSVRLRRMDAAAACGGRAAWDMVLVNIGATVIARALPAVAGALAPGGRVVLSGILLEDEPALLPLAGRLGLGVRRRLRRRPWCGLLLEMRRATRGRPAVYSPGRVVPPRGRRTG